MADDETSDAPAAIIQDERLGGEPRLKGHRIGVFHIWTHYRHGKTPEAIAEAVYPHLRIEQIEAAIEYARTHSDRMASTEIHPMLAESTCIPPHYENSMHRPTTEFQRCL